MNFIEVRKYFRDILVGLNYREWKDPFSIDNIPSSIIDKSFQLTDGLTVGGTANQTVHTFNYPITVNVIFKGYAKMSDGIDKAWTNTEIILDEILKPSNRLGDIIKDVVPNDIQPIPLGVTNDNIIVMQMNFTALLPLCFNN